MKGKSLLYRYVFSFLIVLLIPLIIVCSFFIYTITQTLSQQFLENSRADFASISTNLNREIDKIASSAIRLSNGNIHRYTLTTPSHYGKIITNELRNNLSSSDLLSNIYITSPNMEFSYSCFSTVPTKSFYNRLVNSEGNLLVYPSISSNEELYQELNEKQNGVIYGDQNILSFFSFPTTSMSSDTFLIFQIDRKELAAYLSQLAPNDSHIFSIYNEEDVIIYTHSILEERQKALEAQLFIPPNSVNPQPTTWQQKNSNHILYASSSLMEWDYFYVIPKNNLIQTVWNAQMKMFLIILLVFVCGNLLVALFSYISYRPIRNLRESLEKLTEKNYDKDNLLLAEKNELEVIEYIAKNLHGSIQDMEQVDDESRQALKYWILNTMIQGQIEDYAAMEKTLTSLGISLARENFFVVTMALYEHGAPKEKSFFSLSKEYLDYLESYPTEEHDIYAIRGLESTHITLIICSPDNILDNHQEFLHQLQQDFSTHFSVTSVLGVGQFYSQLSYLSTSFMQSTTALEHRFSREGDSIFFFSPEESVGSIDIKYQNMLKFLEKSIISLNPDGVRATIQYILEISLRSVMTLYSARFLCNNILETATSTFYQYKYGFDNQFMIRHNLSTVLAIQTQSDFTRFMNDIAGDIVEVIEEYSALYYAREESSSDKAQLAHTITSFLDDHFAEQQLTLGLVAESLGYSTSYLSREFKEHHGITIWEYVNEKRMEKAKILLFSTENTIDQIVVDIGYYDTSSFIRKFRNNTGMTPGEYRKGYESLGKEEEKRSHKLK